MDQDGARLPEYALLACICAIVIVAVLYSAGVGR